MDANFIYTMTTWIIPLLLCVIIHEIGHGYAALKLGDETARIMRRLTLNPKDHIDPMGSLLVPGILFLIHSPVLFGWAKPVPVDYRNLRHPKRDMGIVAIAGPVANILLAVAFVLMFHIVALLPASQTKIWAIQNLVNGVQLSLVLAIFNLLPILPLDGGRVVSSLLPLKYSIEYQKTENYGFYILIGLMFVGPMLGINVIGWFINTLYPLFASFISIFI